MRRVIGTMLALVLSGAAAEAQSHLVIVSGVGGDAERRERFYTLAQSLMNAAEERLGVPRDNIVYLGEKPERDPERIAARSTKENVERVLSDLATRVGATAQLTVVLIGHGSFRGEEARFNVPGPDMTAQDFAKLLEKFPTQSIAFVNTASASGDFVAALSGPRRTIVTATKSGFERNETTFGTFFVDAFASEGADVDKDERVSLLEAFTYATREVRRVYDQDGRLLTEHALLDDNGDGNGSTDPDPTVADGALARAFFLGGARTVRHTETDDPELERLYAVRDSLEGRIAELRTLKDGMAPGAYETELERLLLELARASRTIREREKTE